MRESYFTKLNNRQLMPQEEYDRRIKMRKEVEIKSPQNAFPLEPEDCYKMVYVSVVEGSLILSPLDSELDILKNLKTWLDERYKSI